MVKIIWTATCASIIGIATAALIAQAAPPRETPSAEQTAPSRDRHVIVTGCLSPAPAQAGAPTGTAGTSGSAAVAFCATLTLWLAAVGPRERRADSEQTV